MEDLDLVNKVLTATQATPTPTPVEEPTIVKSGYPTIIVDLPSQGLFYPEGHPLASGQIELRFMTAKDEDILTTESYIKKGVVFEKLFQNLLITKVNYDEILVADRDALMIAARANAYGELYDTKVIAPSGKEVPVSIDLLEIPHLEIDKSLITPGQNRFEFEVAGSKVVFKLLTNGDQKVIEETLNKGKRADQADPQFTSRIAHMIQSVDGNADKVKIKIFVKDMLARDARLLRAYIKKVQPGVDMGIELIDPDTFQTFKSDINFGLDFFWPDAGI